MDLKRLYKKRRPVDYLIYTAALLPGIILDIITKALAVAHLYPNGSFTVIEGIFSFTYHENTGAAWGMLKDAPWVFNSVSVVAIAAILLYLYLGHCTSTLRAVSLAVIASGGIGNMIERLGQGYVVDFLHATFIDFPIFNVADCCVTVGAGVLILSLVLEIIDESMKGKKSNAESHGESEEEKETEE